MDVLEQVRRKGRWREGREASIRTALVINIYTALGGYWTIGQQKYPIFHKKSQAGANAGPQRRKKGECEKGV
jgi:hypothetical protein